MLRTLPRIRFSVPAVLVVILALAALSSPWTVPIAHAQLALSFGFQNPACWLAALFMVVAVVNADATYSVLALLASEVALVGWYAWTYWLVTTPRFTSTGFPFVGADIIANGWYVAALGLLIAGLAVAWRLVQTDVKAGREIWLLAALPGFGLMRLGRWGRGLMWASLCALAVYLAATSSPDMTIWQEFGPYASMPPAPPTRAPVWILLGIALLVALLSVVDTVRERRRQKF